MTTDTVATLESLSQTRVADCYQCGKCTAGCPMAAHMDIAPNRVIRLLQLGDPDSALRSDAIWQCLTCETCTTRCPKKVDCAAIMDALRVVSYQSGMVSFRQEQIVLFEKAFLDNIRRNGRMDELELIAQYKLRGFVARPRLGFLFKDATLAPKLTIRHKLHLRGEKVRDRSVVRRIFDRCMDKKR